MPQRDFLVLTKLPAISDRYSLIVQSVRFFDTVLSNQSGKDRLRPRTHGAIVYPVLGAASRRFFIIRARGVIMRAWWTFPLSTHHTAVAMQTRGCWQPNRHRSWSVARLSWDGGDERRRKLLRNSFQEPADPAILPRSPL